MSIPGVKTKLIKANKTLYKGDNKKYNDQYLPNNTIKLIRGPAFFALDPKVALGYGVVFEFKTTKDLHVVKLDDFKTMKAIYDNAPDNIQKILYTNYGYRPDEIIERDSDHLPDRKLSEYLCHKGYDGYLLENGITDADGTFHKELMLCDMTHIKFLKMVNSKKDAVIIYDKFLEKEEQKRIAPKRKEKQSRSHLIKENEDTSYKNPGLFGSDTPETPPSSKSKKSFVYGTPSPSKSKKVLFMEHPEEAVKEKINKT